MMAFIYNFVLLPDFRGSLQVRFVFITTFRAFSCRVVDSFKSCLHETSLNAQPFRFLSRKNRTLIHFSSSELRGNLFLDSLDGILRLYSVLIAFLFISGRSYFLILIALLYFALF